MELKMQPMNVAGIYFRGVQSTNPKPSMRQVCRQILRGASRIEAWNMVAGRNFGSRELQNEGPRQWPKGFNFTCPNPPVIQLDVGLPAACCSFHGLLWVSAACIVFSWGATPNQTAKRIGRIGLEMLMQRRNMGA